MEAKENTYAGNGEKETLENGSKRLVYAKGIWRYEDTYIGSNPIIGMEVAWRKDKPHWGMSYYGRIASLLLSEEEIFDFLKESLLDVKKDMPMRGPEHHENNGLHYNFNLIFGTIQEFAGTESIRKKKENLYEGRVMGGMIR